MKPAILGLLLLATTVQPSYAQQASQPPSETIETAATQTPEQQEIIDLSKKTWNWMSEKNVGSLNNLFDDKAMFTHMGGTWGKAQELDTIKSGGIWYKHAEVYGVSVNTFGNMAVALQDIDLQAVVGGRQVTSAFMVTEVFYKQNGQWKMAQLTFSHLIRPVKLQDGNS